MVCFTEVNSEIKRIRSQINILNSLKKKWVHLQIDFPESRQLHDEEMTTRKPGIGQQRDTLLPVNC